MAALVLLAGIGRAAAPSTAKPATVTHVTDGDTAYLKPLRYGDKVESWPGRSARFIGVDTPEVYGNDECFGPEASAFTKRKLDGARVKVTYGKDPVDPYDRALIYVWRKGKLFNATLIRRGYARTSFYSPNYRYRAWLLRLEERARSEGRGLWGACS